MKRTQTLKSSFISLLVLLGLMSAASHADAHAHAANNPEVAGLPKLLPQTPALPLTLKAGCDGDVVVFFVQNHAPRWRERGKISIVEAATGRVVRERRLALAQRQVASFRVASNEVQGGHSRVSVHVPNGRVTHVQSFSGHCVADSSN